MSRYCNREFHDLLIKARGSLDLEVRLKYYEQALQVQHDDAACLFLWNGYDMYGMNNRVQNWEPSPDASFCMIMDKTTIKD